MWAILPDTTVHVSDASIPCARVSEYITGSVSADVEPAVPVGPHPCSYA